MKSFAIQEYTSIDDGIGGTIKAWTTKITVEGYIDLISGTDRHSMQNAFTEESTHILIIPHFTKGVADDMRVVDKDRRFYHITYSDDPMSQQHHNEIYLKYGGVLSE